MPYLDVLPFGPDAANSEFRDAGDLVGGFVYSLQRGPFFWLLCF